MKKTFDSNQAAANWLDAYRGKSFDLVDMYASNATLECNCIDATINGAAAIQEFWSEQFKRTPALKLIKVRPVAGEMVFVTYETTKGTVSTFLGFDSTTGKIEWQRCGPVVPTGGDLNSFS